MRKFPQTTAMATACPPDLNTTPLIDVMLVLLVLMITTLPGITHATKLALAAGNNRSATPPIYVDLDYDGALYADGVNLATPAALVTWASRLARTQPERSLQIRADRRANYGRVAFVLATLQRQGLRKVSVNALSD